MKKLQILSLLTVLSISSMQSANAGLAIGAIAGNAGSGAKLGMYIGGGAGTVLGLFAALMGEATAGSGGGHMDAGGWIMGIGGGAIIGGAIGALLDVDSNLSSELLIKGFKAKYPFINSPEALNELAATVKSKMTSQPSASTYYVSLSSSEVLAALSGAQITPEQFAIISGDLK